MASSEGSSKKWSQVSTFLLRKRFTKPHGEGSGSATTTVSTEQVVGRNIEAREALKQGGCSTPDNIETLLGGDCGKDPFPRPASHA